MSNTVRRALRWASDKTTGIYKLKECYLLVILDSYDHVFSDFDVSLTRLVGKLPCIHENGHGHSSTNLAGLDQFRSMHD